MVAMDSWQSELEELLSLCERRASRAEQLPHCAICARYANTSPAFEAVLSLLEKLQPEHVPQALTMARARLARVPASQRSQQVNAETFGVLLDSPGWPLVGHLIIDLVSMETARFLSHPGLRAIEELTLLGFAYGNATATSSFTQALLESSLLNVRVLRLHSADFADEDRSLFWASPFAARLDRMEGLTYRGEALPHPLQASEIILRGAWDPVPDLDSLLRLLAPEATPRLSKLDLGSYYAQGAAPALLRLLAAHRAVFERIEEVSLAVYGRGEVTQQLLAEANLPRTVRRVSWSWHSTHGTIFTFSGEIHTVYSPTNGDDVSGINAITHYPNLIAELADVANLSCGAREIKLIAPPEASPTQILEALERFPALERLSLVYPFTEAQLLPFLEATRYLSHIELYLTMRTGCSTTNYITKHAAGYRSDVTPGFLLAIAEEARAISLYSDSLDISRTSTGVEHLTLKRAKAVLAVEQFGPKVSIESLTLATFLTAKGAEVLVRSGVLSRVYGLALQQGLSEEAATRLAECAQLREVRAFSLAGHGAISPTAFALLIGSPHLAGVLELSLWTLPEGGDMPLSVAPLLPRLVTLDLHGCERSEALPASGRFTWLRQISEWLTAYLLEYGKLARLWLRSGAAAPLAARLEAFLRWVYRVPSETAPELIAALDAAQSEEETREAIRDLIARAFGGEPIPDGTPFANLGADQQAALRAVVRVNDYYWCVAGLLSPVFKSYGLPAFERQRLEEYIAGVQH